MPELNDKQLEKVIGGTQAEPFDLTTEEGDETPENWCIPKPYIFPEVPKN